MNSDLVGWLATAVFTSSYFSKQPAMLRRVQAVAASLWLTYGVMIHSVPVIVANAIVMAVALGSSFRIRAVNERE
jgi:Bacterial inner membrane protein